MSKQLSFFDEEAYMPEPVKIKYQWSIYAVPRYYDGAPVETVVNAYTEKQARFLFYQNYSNYLVTECYRI